MSPSTPGPSPSVTAGSSTPVTTTAGPTSDAPTVIATVGATPPAPALQQPAPSSLAAAGLLSGAVFAALLSACVAVWTARRKSREEERARQRDLFAGAYEAYAAYKELPYAIRRRRHDEPAAERTRLSETTREIQGRLSYYLAWTAAESNMVGNAYATLVQELRKTAGSGMRQAWQDPPIEDDHAMNTPPAVIDLSALVPFEKAFTRSVRDHLAAIAPWWAK